VVRIRRVHRRRAAAVGSTLVLFVTALALWTRGGGSGSGSLANRPPSPQRTDIAASVTGSSPTPGAAGSGTAARGGPSLPPFPVSTNINDYNRGPVTVTFLATGDRYIGGVAYVVEGHSPKRKYTVASPMSVSVRTPYGARVAMTVQVAPEGVTATCSVAINGVVKVTYTARGANRVVACVV
jgi:hypothetical protein